tara:strand:+ start:1178 stop:1909 length:732 start_codon:yes stop_codon:yes gene_type:complete
MLGHLKKFTIILNSRGRFLYLENLLNSIKNTTSNLSDIEVLISCDIDDDSTTIFWQNNSSLWPFAALEFIPRERNLHIRLNNLARRANGKYIFVLNDDCEILNSNWDAKAYQALEYFPDNIIYGRTHDGSCDKDKEGEYASFPILSKRAVETVGFFMHERFPGLGGDVAIYRVYNEIGRIIDIDVSINHLFHNTVEDVVNPDKTAIEMRQITYASANDIWTFDISQEVNNLKEYISEKAISCI